MAGRPSLDERLRRVRALRDELDPALRRAPLERALADPSNLVVAEAAKIVADLELSGFEADLLRAWERFLVDPVKTDKGCAAKAAVVDALARTGYDDVDFYKAGLRYTQIEPAWPDSEDTAVNVRGGCAFGLARSRMMRPVPKLMLFVDLLDSPTRADRVHAAQAIADTGSESALPLLKQKLLSGDPHAEVLGACMSGLMRLDAAETVPLVVACLDAPHEDIVIEAAAALGECGRPEAVEALIERAGRAAERERLRTFLSSIGLSRNPRGIDFLIARVEAGGRHADLAVEALRPACVYAETRERVRAAVEKTGEPRLKQLFARGG